MTTPEQPIQGVWNRVVESVKLAVIAPPMWRALEKTVPVVWEGDVFVVGLRAADGNVAGSLGAYETRLAIERALRDVTGRPSLNYRLIEGDSLADWEYTKARDAAAVAGQQKAVVRTQAETVAAGTWDEVYDRIAKLWSAAESRGSAAGRGRFLNTALNLTEESIRKFYPEVLTKPVDTQDRGLSRVLERIASYTSSDAALIGALLFERLK